MRRFDARIRVSGVEYVGGVQECRAIHADIDEGRLHARQYPGNAALINVADQSAAAGPLQKDFLQHAVFDDGSARLMRAGIDQNFGAHGLIAPRNPSVTPAAFSSSAVSNSGNPITPE
jgi:hypothetical protein